ncbi:MAG TPA: hypothetical protein VNU48_13660 [Burkholderiaceae bacterium]|nr:hypothetical protein [Burkholderiaceae bacterium]
MNTSPVSSEPADYELRYQSLFNAGRAYAFPCDAEGHVDIDALSDHARGDYFYARALVGRELSMPSVIPSVARHRRVARP